MKFLVAVKASPQDLSQICLMSCYICQNEEWFGAVYHRAVQTLLGAFFSNQTPGAAAANICPLSHVSPGHKTPCCGLY